MLGKSRVGGTGSDSGYCENLLNEGKHSRSSSSDYLINPESSMGVELNNRLELGDGDTGALLKCRRLSTDLITPQMSVSDKSDSASSSTSSRMTGSSCQALRHAVAALNRLDDFTCEKIGSGFFSEVFKVTHRTTGQVMVLKMNLLRSNRPNMLKEVQLMNQLSHPNILGFMGVCVHEGQLHALTEYINGGSLEQLNLRAGVDLPHRSRMRLAADIAHGMEYLHSRGVFHRDLTSKNVLIKTNDETDEMMAVVGDFGLAAKIPDPKSGYRLPTVGSPYWMSPECLKGQWYDQRSDVFSYGIVLCELIARCEADPDVLPRTENFGLDYLAVADMCGPCPPDFLKLAFLCCNFEPKSRPSFTEIVKRLTAIISDYDGSADKPVPLEAAPGKMGAGIGARSEEALPHAGAAVETKESVQHKKLIHRRSLSEDVGSIVFPPHTAPSDKARCHFLRPVGPPLLTAKHVGESMLEQDPHYKPTSTGDKANPFAALSQFRGVKKILGAPKQGPSSLDLFSSCFELPAPFTGPAGHEPGWLKHPRLKRTPDRPGRDDDRGKSETGPECIPREKGKPRSLPGSPTLVRRRLLSTSALVMPAWLDATSRTDDLEDLSSWRKSVDEQLRSGSLGQRTCSSNLNLADAGLLSEGQALKRRGSCESGFFSSIGEDGDPLLAQDLRVHNTSSATLSSSSAASSLFLLDDPPCRPHHSLLFAAKRSSSVFTDSSEDVSSLGGGDLYWEELSRSSLGQQPQQISKIVEYFERKQGGVQRQMLHNASPIEFARRLEGASLNEALRKSLERVAVAPHTPAQAQLLANRERTTGCVRRSVNATQRLMICEGAVKSKLPLFDKK